MGQNSEKLMEAFAYIFRADNKRVSDSSGQGRKMAEVFGVF